MTAPTLSASAVPLSPPSPSARVAVSAAFFLNGFGLGSWTPEVPIVGERLGLSQASFGFMILIFGLGAVISMPFIGSWIARRGSKPPLMATQILFAVAMPLLILAPHPILTAAAVFLFGMGIGGMDVAINASAVSVERGLGRSIMSSCHGFWSLGAVAGAGIGGSLIAALGPQGHMLVVGAVVLLSLLYMKPRLLDDRTAARPIRTSEAAAAKPSFTVLLRERRAPLLLSIAIGLMALAGFVQEGVVIDWSAVYLRDDLGASVVASGFGFAIFSVAMAGLRFLGDGIRDRFGAVRTVRVFLLAALCGSVILMLANSLPVALVGFFVLGIGLANVVPIAFSAAGNVKGLADGTGISIASGIAYAGGLIAPAMVGLISAAYGFTVIFAAAAVLAALVFLSANLLQGADREQR